MKKLPGSSEELFVAKLAARAFAAQNCAESCGTEK
jgi:hypothetical protein